MRKRVTIIDVAHAAGVSPSTVSLVLREDGSISAATTARVREAMTELGYVYHRAAASLRGTSMPILGVIIHDLANSVFTEIAIGIDEKFQSSGFVQFIANSADDPDRQRRIITSMREHGVAGLIVSPASGTPVSDLDELTDAGLPVVQVGRSIDAQASAVVSDNKAGVALAVHHLYELGHREIAFLGGHPNTATFARRAEGYRAAAHELGIQVRRPIQSSPTRQGGRDAFDEVLREPGPTPSAYVCFNDIVAFGVLDRARDRGTPAGVDISVVGFDDVPEAANAMPALTTIAIDPQSVGATAASILLQHVADKALAPTRVIHPVRLIVRDSTQPLPR